MAQITSHIAGIKFRDGAADHLALDANDGDALTLEPEPTNEYDPNAVKILHGDFHVGYVPGFLSEKVKGYLDKGLVTSVRLDGPKAFILDYADAPPEG